MSTHERISDAPLVRQLIANAGRFSFVQASRIILRASAQVGRTYGRIGGREQAASEPIRYVGHHSLLFSTTDILKIEVENQKGKSRDTGQHDELGGRLRVTTTVCSLTGVTGPMPIVFTTELIANEIEGNTARADFYNLFNHRLASLCYRASERSLPALEMERELVFEQSLRSRESTDKGAASLADARGEHESRFRKSLLAILGLHETETQALIGGPTVDELAGFAALWLLDGGSAWRLRTVIGEYFGASVQIVDFKPTMMTLREDDRSRLLFDEELSASQSCLGGGSLLGELVLSIQNSIEIRIGPVREKLFRQLLPGAAGHMKLAGLIQACAGPHLQILSRVVFDKVDWHPAVLGDDQRPALLGWVAWLAGPAPDHHPDDTEFWLNYV